MTPALLAAALLAGSPTTWVPAGVVPAIQLGGLFDGLFGDAEPVDDPIRPESGSGLRIESGSAPAFESASGMQFESGSGLSRGFDPLPEGAYDNPPRFSGESGSGTIESGSGIGRFFDGRGDGPRDRGGESGSGWRLRGESGSGVESGSDPYGGRPNPFGQFSERSSNVPGVTAPPPRRRLPEPRDRGALGGGFDPNELPPPTEPPPAPNDARVHALLVSLGWIAALVAGGLAGYLLGLSRGAERRRRSLEPRQLDLAGEIAETADSLMAAANAGEAGRFEACVDRLRERVGRTAVLLDDRSAGAVRELVATATGEPVADRDARLQTAYDGLVAALRRSVRGG